MRHYLTKPEGLNLGNIKASLLLIVVFIVVILLGIFSNRMTENIKE